jgi:predicted GNAT superfamily acetyltransferase
MGATDATRRTVVRSPAGDDVLDKVAAEAATDAEHAAHAAGVTIRTAESVPDLQALTVVGNAVWGPNGTYATNEMRALAFAGGVVLGAYDPTDERSGPVGFLVSFLGWNGGLHLHSHQTGVVPGWRGVGVGYALKLAQREICLHHGIEEVRWTFDPLVLRNTSFNLGRLGAQAVQFLPDFYGEMSDSVNSNDLSDRMEAVWRLADPLPPADPVPNAGGTLAVSARPAALVSSDGWPKETGLPPTAGDHVAIPKQFARLRQREPERARAWRLAVRRVLSAAYASGLRIGQVDGDGYVLTAGQPGE